MSSFGELSAAASSTLASKTFGTVCDTLLKKYVFPLPCELSLCHFLNVHFLDRVRTFDTSAGREFPLVSTTGAKSRSGIIVGVGSAFHIVKHNGIISCANPKYIIMKYSGPGILLSWPWTQPKRSKCVRIL